MKEIFEVLVALSMLAFPLIVAGALAAVSEGRDGRTRLVIVDGRVRRRRSL